MNKQIKKLSCTILGCLIVSSLTPTTIVKARTVDDDFSQMIENVKDRLDNYKVSNTTTKADITKVIQKIVNTNDFKITFNDFEVIQSTENGEGSITGTIIIQDKNKENADDMDEIDYNVDIPEISQTQVVKTYEGEDKAGFAAQSNNQQVVDLISDLVEQKLKFDSSSTTITLGSSTMTNIFNDGSFVGVVIQGEKAVSFPLETEKTKFKNSYVYMPEINRFVKSDSSKIISVQNQSIDLLENTNNIYYLTNTEIPADYVTKTGWYEKDNEDYYIDAKGIHSGWIKDQGFWYYLDATTNTKQTGWLHTNNNWYYLDTVGKMTEGWLQVDGTWYYFVPKNGNMAVGLTKVDKTYYFFNDDGSRFRGWKCIDSKWHYFSQDGTMAINTTIDGYSINKNGIWDTKAK